MPLKSFIMPGTLHIRIKKEYAGALIEDLIKVNAVEMVEEDTIELNAEQRAALDKELQAIKSNPDFLLNYNEVKHRFKKP